MVPIKRVRRAKVVKEVKTRFYNRSFLQPFPTYTSTTAAFLNFEMAERPSKRRKLQYSKCKQCRKDRQAVSIINLFLLVTNSDASQCKPVDRISEQPCDRCIKYEYCCSANRTKDEEKALDLDVSNASIPDSPVPSRTAGEWLASLSFRVDSR